MEGKLQFQDRKQRKDLENTIEVLKEQCRHLNENLATILEQAEGIFSLMEETNMGFLSRNRALRKEIGDFLGKVTAVLLLEDVNQIQKVKLSTLLVEIWEIYKNMKLGDTNFWAQNFDPWMKMVCFLKKAKRIVAEDSLNQNGKEELYAWFEEICEIYRKMDVRNTDFWALDADLWKKFVALLEEILRIFPEKNGNQDHKGNVSTLWVKLCENYKDSEAINVNICKGNKDLWKILQDILEILKKFFLVEQCLWKDPQLGLEEVKKEELD